MEDKLRLELNEYLVYEFGCDLDQAPQPISVSSPFALLSRVVIDDASPPAIVFEFASDGESFFAVVGDSLDFFPTASMQLNDLADQFLAKTGELLALVGREDHVLAVGSALVPATAGFPSASSWPRLAAAVGRGLRSQA
jgi:hypothetical protein